MIGKIIKIMEKYPTFLRLCAIVFGAALLIWSMAAVDTSHAHTWMEKYIPWFWSLFGFCSCCILIFFVKWFGNSGIQTREDFYDK